jgi:hypothetical protein
LVGFVEPLTQSRTAGPASALEQVQGRLALVITHIFRGDIQVKLTMYHIIYESVMNSAPFGSMRSPFGARAQIASRRFALNVRSPSFFGFTRVFGHKAVILIQE